MFGTDGSSLASHGVSVLLPVAGDPLPTDLQNATYVPWSAMTQPYDIVARNWYQLLETLETGLPPPPFCEDRQSAVRIQTAYGMAK